jgi:hypothetical protein
VTKLAQFMGASGAGNSSSNNSNSRQFTLLKNRLIDKLSSMDLSVWNYSSTDRFFNLLLVS